MSTLSVIALDLEGTLISNAVSVFPRPGLFQFLEFCKAHFEKVMLFTSVTEDRAKSIVRLLSDEGSALIVDDQGSVILPEQKQWWIAIREFEHPYSDEDRELEKISREISTLLKI